MELHILLNLDYLWLFQAQQIMLQHLQTELRGQRELQRLEHGCQLRGHLNFIFLLPLGQTYP